MSEHSQFTTADIRSLISGYFPGDLGIEPVEVGAKRTVARMEVDKRHLHPGQYVHGGVWTALGDTAAAWLTFAVIPAGAEFTTIELKLNVFGSGRDGDLLTAVAEPLHVGRSTAAIEVRMERQRQGSESKLAANLIVTLSCGPENPRRGCRPTSGASRAPLPVRSGVRPRFVLPGG